MRGRLTLLCGAVLAGLSGVATPLARGQLGPSEARVLVLPFATRAGGGSEWLGRAVQQDLFTDLTQGTSAHVIAPSNMPAAGDVDQALRAARDAGASVVVFGQAQASAAEVRLTGDVLDVATGRPMGALKATGRGDDLFHLEDAVAGQIFTSLPRALLTAQALQGIDQQAQPASAPVNPLSRPAPLPPQQQQLQQQEQQQPVMVAADQPSAYPAPAPVPLPQPQAQPQPFVPEGVDVNAAPVVTPAVASPYVSTVYPDYSSYYCDTPSYSYYPEYRYGSLGCDLWSGVTLSIGGYGCYGGYLGYGGYGGYVDHGSRYYGGGYHGYDGYRGYGEYRGYGGYAPRDYGHDAYRGYGGSREYRGYGGSGRDVGRSSQSPLVRGGSFGGYDGAAHASFDASRSARPSYLSPSGGYRTSSGGGYESARSGGSYAGSSHESTRAYSSGASAHSSAGASHEYSGGHGGGGGGAGSPGSNSHGGGGRH